MSDTTSIDAAAAAVDALLAQIETSNARLVQAQDTGTADNYVFAPTPAVASYGPDLLLLADIANPNLTTNPRMNVSGLGWLTITSCDGSAVPVGAVAGKAMIGLSSAAGGSYVARLLSVDAATIAAALGTALASSFATSINSRLAHGQCLFSLASSTSVQLKPKNGDNVIVGGVQTQLAAGGLSAGLTNVPVNGTPGGTLAPSTAYYVALAVIAGVQTLRFWNAATYGHMPDATAGNVGVEVISNAGAPVQAAGVSTDTLVGMVYVNASSQFADTDGARYTLSWFNRRRKKSQTTFSTNRSTTSVGTLIELNSEIRNGFICWSDEVVNYTFNGSYQSNSSSTNGGLTALSFDGGAAEFNQSIGAPYYLAGTSAITCITGGAKVGLPEGSAHYLTMLGAVQGNTGTWLAADSNPTAGAVGNAGCSIDLNING